MDNNFVGDLLVAEKRRHTRYFLFSPIQYGLISGHESTLFRGHTLNLSRSGLCILTNYPLSPGQDIVIKKHILPLAASKATVRWITAIDDENPFGYTYVAGLELAEYISNIITLHE
jgi:hypothetical protein